MMWSRPQARLRIFERTSTNRTVLRPSFACARWTSAASSNRQWSTPLAKNLAEAITTTGPIPVAAYMRQCLTSPNGGYYTSRADGHDQFGRKGDFITSPEISQVFGELIGVWVVAEWMVQGRKSSGVHIMEVGPGRGTLMDDMLRSIRNFKPFLSTIEAIYMVEASPSLRDAQKQLLCGDAPVAESDIGFQSTSKYSDKLKIVWAEDVRPVPKDATKTSFIIAHEFFDALPIHIFQSVPLDSSASSITTSTTVPPTSSSRLPKSNQWRELLVSPTPPNSTHETLSTPQSLRSTNPPPDFQLSLSKTATPHSMYLPELSPRYKALKSNASAIVEVSPEALAYASDFAVRIGGEPVKSPKNSSSRSLDATRLTKPVPSGAALILDYGPSATIPTNSLRGIRAHKAVSPFSFPGQVDISADVDFMALAEAAINASPAVEVHGPVEQGIFLQAMGIQQRAQSLMSRAPNEEAAKRIESGWKRLVDRGPGGMGKVYKAMAIVPHVPPREAESRRRPVGFGGDVVA